MGCAGDHGLARGKAASVAVRACRHSMQGMLEKGGAAQDELHSVAKKRKSEPVFSVERLLHRPGKPGKNG